MTTTTISTDNVYRTLRLRRVDIALAWLGRDPVHRPWFTDIDGEWDLVIDEEVRRYGRALRGDPCFDDVFVFRFTARPANRAA